jgi:hypothetical protein
MTGTLGGISRSARQWLSIGVAYLEFAIQQSQHNNAMGQPLNTASQIYSCAAELMLRTVRTHLQSIDTSGLGAVFAAGEYRHTYTQLLSLKFGDVGLGVVSPGVNMRTVQSFRRQLGASDTNHYLVATWSTYEIIDLVTPVRGNVVTQLLWPITGAVASFGHTDLPTSNQCAELNTPSQLNGAIQQSDYKFRDLSSTDIAVVVDTFIRCDGFPRPGCVKRYNVLRQSLATNTLVLIANIEAPYLIQSATNPNVTSFSYIAHRSMSVTLENPSAAPLNTNKLVLRTATQSLCEDDIATAIATLSVEFVAAYRKPLPGIPFTLSVGQSVCVGGEHSGQNCTMQNDCGENMACRKKPFSKTRNGFCFDGQGWNMAMPCDLPPAGHTTCPYGHCYGQIDGHPGGAYPKLDAWNNANCDNKHANEDAACAQPWYLHAHADSVASK